MGNLGDGFPDRALSVSRVFAWTLVAALVQLGANSPVTAYANAFQAPPASTTCGDGIVDDGEECDPGSPLGSRDCSTLCERTEFEPAGLPFDRLMTLPEDAGDGNAARIFSPGLHCKPFDVRNGARNLEPVHVRYRIHLCRNALGVDSFTTQQVRDVMAQAATEFAKGGIVLEEESLVRFSDADCVMPLQESDWTDALAANTPEGVLAISFVSEISDTVNQFSVGGFCDFFGPLCVNSGAFDTLVIHELGHFFGLAHPFECANGIETAENCADAGDFLCDTPPDRGPASIHGLAICPGDVLVDGSCRGTCAHKVCTDGSTPDGYNWMGYYDCTPGHFSNEQRDFMRCTLDHEMGVYNADGPATTSTTSTTLPRAMCGDINDDDNITAGDALGILRVGVGLADCPNWQCDYNGSGEISASDALVVLKVAVGTDLPANCPPE